MQINYKFSSDIEPTDEQLHLLMQDVAIEVRDKARKSDKKFFEQLQQRNGNSLELFNRRISTSSEMVKETERQKT